MDSRLQVLPLILFLGFSAPSASADSPAPPAPQGAQAKDFCSYLKDVEAKTDEACSTEALAALQAQDQAAFAAALAAAQKRKGEVLAAYDFLKALPPVNGPADAKPASGQSKAAAAPDPMRLQPPINDRTFPAWIGADAPDFKAVYARWLDAKNAELKREQQGPVTEKRNAQIAAELASNQAKLSRLDKIKDPSELSCYLGDACGARGGVSGRGSVSAAAGRKWTADDYKRANAQARDDVQAPGGALDRGIPSEAAAAAVGNSPLGPLANGPASDGSSPLRTAAELALGATGALMLFGGLGGRLLEDKYPNIMRDMGITAGVTGAIAVGAWSLAAITPAAPAATAMVAPGSSSLTPALAGGGYIAEAGEGLSLAQALGRTAAIGGGLLGVKTLIDSRTAPTGPDVALTQRLATNQEKKADRRDQDLRQAEYEQARDFCNTPPKAGENECSTLSKQIDHTERCIQLYESWDADWEPGRHLRKIETYQRRLNNLKEEHHRKCAQK